MELIAFIEDLRAAYVQEFVATYQRESVKGGSLYAEIGFRLSGGVHHGLYIVDYVRRSGESNTVVELGETPSTRRGPASFDHDGSAIVFEALSWDAVEISAEPPLVWTAECEAWFARWLDAEKVPQDGAPVTGIIHSVTIADGVLSVDFGTATPDAMTELLALIVAQGSDVVRLRDARQ